MLIGCIFSSITMTVMSPTAFILEQTHSLVTTDSKVCRKVMYWNSRCLLRYGHSVAILVFFASIHLYSQGIPPDMSPTIRGKQNTSSEVRTLLQRYLDSAETMQYVDARKQEYFAREAMRIAESVLDTSAMIQSHLMLAESYSARAIRFRDVEECQQALSLAQLMNNPAEISSSYNQLSNAYRLLLRYDSSSVFAERAMYFAQQAQDSVLYMNALGNWAQVRVRKREYTIALPIFEQMKDFFATRQIPEAYIGTISRIGYLKGLQGDRVGEIAYYKEGYMLSRKQGFFMLTAHIASTLGAAEYHLQQYQNAVRSLVESLQLADSLEMFDIIEQNHLYLSRTYEALNKPVEALFHYKQFVSIVKRPSVGSNGEQQNLELRRYEEMVSDQQILLLQREAEKQRLERTIVSGILALFVVMTVIGILLWRREIGKRERVQHEQLQLFSSYTSDVITCHDLQGRYTYISPSMTAMLGYSAEELLGYNPYPLIHLDDIEEVKKSYKTMMQNKTTGRQQCRFRTKSGSYKWIEVTYKPILNQQGDITAFIHTTRDVHERVLAEQKLRASQESLRATLFNTPNVSVQWYDAEGKIVLWNKASATMFGWSEQEVLGKTLEEIHLFVEEHDYSEFHKTIQHIFATGETVGPYQYQFRRKDGTLGFGESANFAIPISDTYNVGNVGQQQICVCMDIDITIRHRAEAALQQVNEDLDTIFRTIGVGVAVNVNNRYVFTNQKFRFILGYTEEEFRSLSVIEEIVHPDDRVMIQQRYRERLNEVHPHHEAVEARYRHKGGHYVWMEISGLLMTYQGQKATLVTFIDITERRAAEERLLAREAQLTALIESTSDAIYSLDSAYQLVIFNTAYKTATKSLLGVDLEAGMNVLDFLPPSMAEITASWKRSFDRVLAGEQFSIIYEPEFLQEPSYTEIMFNPIHNDDGEVTGIVAFNRDITPVKQAEQRLRKNEAEARAVLESTTDQIYSLDSKYYLITFNSAYAAAARKLFNVEIKPGMNVMDFIPDAIASNPAAVAEEHQIWQGRYDRCLAGERFSVVYSQDLNGEVQYFEHLYNPIFDADGNVVGIVAFNRDITQMKRAEERIKDSERILHQTGQMAKVGGWEIDIAGDKRLVQCTETTLVIFGRPLDTLPTWEMLLSHYDESFHPVLEEIITKSIATRETQEYETQMTTCQGNRRWVYSQVHIEQRNDTTVRLFGAIQDITDRKETELLIQQQLQALEEKNAEMERFTYTVSHDLKSPLITIRGFLGMIQEDIQAADYSRVSKDLLRIDNAATKMQHLLEDLLELSRVGRVIKPQERFSMTILAKETVELLEGILTIRKVKVRVQADMPIVIADKERFREVYQNLIENATKFMGKDNTQPLIEVGCVYDDIEPIFFVRDNGIGIAKQYQQTIFGLFDKLDQHSDGTGIGLALVKRIVELHGGRIWVESDPGQGATFYFTCKQKNTDIEAPIVEESLAQSV